MRVAVVQEAPPLLDRAGAIELAILRIREAAKAGASLVVFPEAYIGGYPAWIWRLSELEHAKALSELHLRLAQQACDVARGDLDPLAAAAREGGTVVVVGLNEVSCRRVGGTVFNSVATIGSDGRLLNLHRKLMPTGPERTIWAAGDAQGLRVVDTPIGRIGTLICWEAYMPLSRFALYAEGVEILVIPTWDHHPTWQASMGHIAKEGACWVVSTATSLASDAVPADLPGAVDWRGSDAWICTGNAMVVRPSGRIAAGPLPPEEPVLIGEFETDAACRAKRLLDVAGHYARPDIFQLAVDRSPRGHVSFRDGPESSAGSDQGWPANRVGQVAATGAFRP